MKNELYIELGFKNRSEYLDSLSEEYNTDPDTVYTLADLLGYEEDFDGLVNALEDNQMEF